MFISCACLLHCIMKSLIISGVPFCSHKPSGWDLPCANSNAVCILTYRPFYKIMTTCGPLPKKWCIKVQKISECVIEVITSKKDLLQISQWETCGRGFSDNIGPISILLLALASRRLWSGVSSAIWFLLLDFLCFILENVLSNTHVFPNMADSSNTGVQFLSKYVMLVLTTVTCL